MHYLRILARILMFKSDSVLDRRCEVHVHIVNT